jgi:hypothetical protein
VVSSCGTEPTTHLRGEERAVTTWESAQVGAASITHIGLALRVTSTSSNPAPSNSVANSSRVRTIPAVMTSMVRSKSLVLLVAVAVGAVL